MTRLKDLKKFYRLMNMLEKNTEGRRKLGDCDPATDTSIGGVYFFFEKGQRRTGSGKGDRVIRVGNCTSYRRRISRQHKGPGRPLTGSIFRKWVANALFVRHRNTRFSDWPEIIEEDFKGMREALGPEQQQELERLTGRHMRPMHLLFVPIVREDSRRYIERNAIGLLSEYHKDPIDPPSRGWLGRHSRSEKIRSSGLWNSDLVAGGYEPKFLDRLEARVDRARN